MSFFCERVLTKDELKNYSSSALSFVGDALFSLYVRESVCKSCLSKSGRLHAETKEYVNAVAQSRCLDALLSRLSEDELGVINRARNAETKNKAKGATAGEYKQATAFEALIGYLYLSGDNERLKEMLEFSIKKVGGAV